MALTLLESAKLALDNGETKRAAVISQFAESSAFLASLPFFNIPGNSYAYNREGVLPAVAFRAINEAYVESTGVINPAVEALRVAGGDLDVDIALIKMFGDGIRSRHEAMKVKALAQEMSRVLIKGDSTTQPREFDGLEARIPLGNAQALSNGAGAGGAALSLTNLDLAIQMTTNPQAIWCSQAMKARFTAAMRATAVSGVIMQGEDAFGRPAVRYNGLPIVTAYPDNGGTDPITWTEVPTGGAPNTAQSLYVVGIGDGYFQGIQNGEIAVRDLGEINIAPVKRTRVEWLSGIVIEHGRAVTRLHSVSNAAIVA